MTDEEGQLLYNWSLAPALAPDVNPEDVLYSEFRPDQELTWRQSNWAGGALAFYFDPRAPNRYAIADKVWALTPNELSLGYQPKQITFGVRNGSAQLNNIDNWTPSGMSLSVATTAPHSPPYHFTGTEWSTNDYAQVSVVQSEQPVARWRSQAITATARVRGSAAGGTIRMQIVEAGGSSEPTTNGSAISLTETYQTISASVTTQSDSDSIDLRIQMSADGGSNRTVYFDSVQCLPGTIVPNAANCTMKYMDGDLYCVTNRAVWKLDDTNDFWCLQKVHAVITGFEVWDDRLLIGQGESTAYQYSNAGDATTWTAASGGGNKANRFSKTLNVNGNWAAVKSLNDDEIYLTTDPTGTPTWGTAVEVGKDDRDIIQLYQLDGTLGVGKEDGFYEYLSLQGNRFANVYPGVEFMVDSDNFSRGIMYGGFFYTVLGEVGFTRYNGTQWEDLSHVIQSPGLSDFGNRVRAFGTDGQWLYLIIEDLNASSLTKQSWLFALKEMADGTWSVHTLTSLILSDALDCTVFKTSGADNRFLYVNGDVNGEAFVYRMQLPDRTDTPRFGTNADLASEGTLVTSYMDWNRAQVEKSIDRFRIISENLSGSINVAVAYQADNSTTWVDINSENSTFASSPHDAVTVDSGTTSRRVRFRLTLSSNVSTSSPVVKGFVLESNWRPPRLKQWNIVADLEEGVRGLHGVKARLPLKRQLSRIDFLRSEVSPIKMEDIDGSTHNCHIISMSEAQIRVHAAKTRASRYARGLQLTIMETLSQAGEPWDSGIKWDEFFWG